MSKELVKVIISEEASELNGQILYFVYSDGSRSRHDLMEGAENIYRHQGIPVVVGGQALS